MRRAERRKQRQGEAAARVEARDARSKEQQLHQLDKRFGDGLGASRERAKLTAKLFVGWRPPVWDLDPATDDIFWDLPEQDVQDEKAEEIDVMWDEREYREIEFVLPACVVWDEYEAEMRP